MADDPLGVVISAREIYDQIVGVRDDVRTLAQTNTTSVGTIADHETRIRSIERWKYAIPISALSGIVAAAVTLSK